MEGDANHAEDNRNPGHRGDQHAGRARREGAQRMLGSALESEVTTYLAGAWSCSAPHAIST